MKMPMTAAGRVRPREARTPRADFVDGGRRARFQYLENVKEEKGCTLLPANGSP
jgi:hypothetical protein